MGGRRGIMCASGVEDECAWVGAWVCLFRCVSACVRLSACICKSTYVLEFLKCLSK